MRQNKRGVTLVELMVSVAIIGVGILGFFGAFRFISTSLHVSRTRTLATNLAQEKIETLKNLSYYALLITTSSSLDNNFSPAITYDNSNYPPETIVIGGVTFTRYTYVALAVISNDVISTVSFTYPDSGMKQLQSTVIWNDMGTWKKWTLNNLFENPNVNPLDSSITGHIYQNITGTPALPGALVRTDQNTSWSSVTDSNGYYTFRVYHGSYTIRASSSSFYDNVSGAINADIGTNASQDLYLSQIASGTATGNAWISSSVVISQIVISTVQADTGFSAQYVELYNPTTAAITIYNGTAPQIKLDFQTVCTGNGTNGANCTDSALGVQMVYVNNTIPSYGYYVFANTTSFYVNGTKITADAYYADTANTHCSPAPLASNWSPPTVKYLGAVNHGGSFWLTDTNGNILDAVGMAHGGELPPKYEGNYLAYNNGWPAAGEQIVRISSPAANLSVSDMNAYGHAYNSNNNSNDFFYPLPLNAPNLLGIQFNPRTSTYAPKIPVAGTPAVGAYVSASDTFSGSTRAYAAYITSGTFNLLYAPFSLVGVTTGTWVIQVASGNFYAGISTVIINQGVTTGVPNGITVSSWPAPNVMSVMMTSTSLNGFVAGNITDIYNNPINGITVSIPGGNKVTEANGNYFGSTSSGSVTIIANPNNLNPTYVQQINQVTVNTGQIVTQNFILSKGGSVQGYLTSATTPLPNYVVSATIGSYQYGSGTSDLTGVFTIRNLSTGTYTIAPILDSGQDSSPLTISATVVSSTTLWVGTFTVTGAFGNISGSVSNGASSITSGALVLASTASIPSTPPAIAASSSAALAPLYAVSSKADGTYTVPVRGSNTYYISVYVPSIAANGNISITTKTFSTVYVSPGQTTTQNLTVP